MVRETCLYCPDTQMARVVSLATGLQVRTEKGQGTLGEMLSPVGGPHPYIVSYYKKIKLLVKRRT